MSKKDFKPHKMYKDGKAVMANTYQQHLSLGKKEYDHSATPLKRKGCGPQSLGSAIKLAPILGMIAKKVIVDKVSEKISGGTPLKDKKVLDHTNTTCWPGHAPKPGEPKTKISSKTGRRVNNCS
jgi:hypothetical protein